MKKENEMGPGELQVAGAKRADGRAAATIRYVAALAAH